MQLRCFGEKPSFKSQTFLTNPLQVSRAVAFASVDVSGDYGCGIERGTGLPHCFGGPFKTVCSKQKNRFGGYCVSTSAGAESNRNAWPDLKGVIGKVFKGEQLNTATAKAKAKAKHAAWINQGVAKRASNVWWKTVKRSKQRGRALDKFDKEVKLKKARVFAATATGKKQEQIQKVGQRLAKLKASLRQATFDGKA